MSKFDSILSEPHLIFLVVYFVKCLQVYFVHPSSFVFSFALAIVDVFVLNLFRQQFHQLSDPLFQRMFLRFFSAVFFATFFTAPFNTLPTVIRVSRITPDPLCLYRIRFFHQKILPTRSDDSWLYIYENKIHSCLIINLTKISIPLRSRAPPIPSVTLILTESIIFLFTGCQMRISGSFSNG